MIADPFAATRFMLGALVRSGLVGGTRLTSAPVSTKKNVLETSSLTWRSGLVLIVGG